LENLGYTPALPVVGLNVELHNYQLQSLQWALDQEGLKGGILRQLFAPVLNSNGEDTGMWFSPFLGETVEVGYELVDIRGGFICDEVQSLSVEISKYVSKYLFNFVITRWGSARLDGLY
jgi:hypothetical protein